MSRRGALVGSVAIYVLLLNWTYAELVAPVYTYVGLSFSPLSAWQFAFCFVLCIVPSFWAPVRVTRPSQLLFLVQYVVMFVPTTFIAFYSSVPTISAGSAIALDVVMFAGLSIIQLGYVIPVRALRMPKMSPTQLLMSTCVGSLVLLAYVTIYFRDVFQFATLENVYEVRTAMYDAAKGSGWFTLYAQMWLAGFLLPFLFSVGAFAKKLWLVVLAESGYIILFGIAGNKLSLLSMTLLPLLFMWSRRSRRSGSASFVLGAALVVTFGWVFRQLGGDFISTWYVAIVNVRTFAVPPLQIVQYFDFFGQNPTTFLSHVRGVNLLIQYPYDTDLGTLISWAYYRMPWVANAGLWAGDGLAGFGLFGIIVMSVVCTVIFWVIDAVAASVDTEFALVALGVIASEFSNTSLFTTLLSGGLGLLLAALAVMPNAGIFRCARQQITQE